MKNVISSEVQGIKLLTNVSTKKVDDSFLMVSFLRLLSPRRSMVQNFENLGPEIFFCKYQFYHGIYRVNSQFSDFGQSYIYQVLQTIQMKLIL